MPCPVSVCSFNFATLLPTCTVADPENSKAGEYL